MEIQEETVFNQPFNCTFLPPLPLTAPLLSNKQHGLINKRGSRGRHNEKEKNVNKLIPKETAAEVEVFLFCFMRHICFTIKKYQKNSLP